MEKIHMITYGNNIYSRAKERIKEEALHTTWFKSIKVCGPEDLTPEFANEFKKVLKLKRIAGYGVWKFDIILKRLETLIKDNKDEILLYIDAGCMINKNGESRMKQYINMLMESDKDMFSFKMPGAIEKNWTTKQLFKAFEVEEEMKKSGQFVGGIFMMKINESMIDFFKDILTVLRKNPLIITDVYNKYQTTDFIDNRHDQSVLSVMRKKMKNSVYIDDETFWTKWNYETEEAQKHPLMAVRRC